MTPHRQGLLSLHAAVFLFGITALFSKLIALPALDITMLRSVFAVIAIALLMRVFGEGFFLRSRKDYAVALVLGLLLGTHWWTYFHAMQTATVAIGVIALFTYPVMTVFLEPLFYGGRPHVRDIVSGFVVLLGVFIMTPEFNLHNDMTLGVLSGLLSALLFALRNILQGKYFNGYGARPAMLYQISVVALMYLPFVAQDVSSVGMLEWQQLLVLGIFFTAMPHAFFAKALRHLSAKTAGLVACLQVVWGSIFAWLILDEMPHMTTLIGGGLIVLAAAYESFAHQRPA